ncbi:MAG: hypothetical protein IKB93_17185 [Clostridia bacterium]|nr:hypothetical protein [Clostridia bacterium]
MKNDYLNTLEESDMLLRDDFELEFDKQRILFPIECWFDVDKKFGLNTQGNDGLWVNLYGEYNPCANEVKISYVINADDGTFEREYIPTDTERELFVKLMEQACEQYTGMTCRELYITDYVAQHASGFELECQSAGDKIAIINRTDNFVLYTEDKGGKLENHIGHSIELATYGGKQCIALECMDCNEILYDTATEELQFNEEQGGMTMQ